MLEQNFILSNQGDVASEFLCCAGIISDITDIGVDSAVTRLAFIGTIPFELLVARFKNKIAPAVKNFKAQTFDVFSGNDLIHLVKVVSDPIW